MSIAARVFVLGGLPGFVLALLLLYVFAAATRLFPPGGLGGPGEQLTVATVASHLVLPAAALAFGHHFGTYVRLVETGVGRLTNAPHVENARVRGVPRWQVLTRHLARPGLGPFAARVGVGVGGMISGAYATEMIFSWPGLGREAIESARAQDYPVLVAIVLITAVTVVLANLLAEFAVALLDPRVQRGYRVSADVG